MVRSPAGQLLVTRGNDGARLRDLAPDRLVDAACAGQKYVLTEVEWDAVVPQVPFAPPCG